MSLYGNMQTWKVVYSPKVLSGGQKGVALIEAVDRQQAMYTFSKQYAGQYFVIESCSKLI